MMTPPTPQPEPPMRSLDLEQLRSFVAVVDARSISGGAAVVFRSQSAISEQLQKLEAVAGAPLLLRSRAGVRPTPAGERLLAHARQLLAIGELALRDVQERTPAVEVRLAISDYFRPAEVAALLRHVARACPQLRLQVTVGQSAALAEGHARRDYDLALVMEIKPGRAGARPLRREALSWLAAPHFRPHPDEPLALVLLPDSCAVHRTAVRALQQRGIAHVVAHTCSGVAGLQSAIAAGLGVGCLNASAIVDGLVPAPRSLRLPPLPAIAFRLLAPPRGAPAAMIEADTVLRAHFR